MNNITIELCAEDRQRLDQIIAALEMNPPVVGVAPEVDPGFGVPVTAPAPAPAAPAEPPTVDPAVPLDTPEQAAAGKTDSRPAGELRGELRKKCLTLSAAGRKHEALAVLKQYAASITDIPDDKCADALAAMVALEG